MLYSRAQSRLEKKSLELTILVNQDSMLVFGKILRKCISKVMSSKILSLIYLCYDLMQIDRQIS